MPVHKNRTAMMPGAMIYCYIIMNDDFKCNRNDSMSVKWAAESAGSDAILLEFRRSPAGIQLSDNENSDIEHVNDDEF